MKQIIEKLGKKTEISFSHTDEVKFAFQLGLWWGRLPSYMLPHVQEGRGGSIPSQWREEGSEWWNQPAPAFQFAFVSDTADSWHQCYHDLRSKGWRRTKVHREGGQLQYLFVIEDFSKPEGFETVDLHLLITISTCKQVQIGTETKEVPVYEIQCEGLRELDEEENEKIAEIFNKPVSSATFEEQPVVLTVANEATKAKIAEYNYDQRVVDSFDDDIPF